MIPQFLSTDQDKSFFSERMFPALHNATLPESPQALSQLRLDDYFQCSAPKSSWQCMMEVETASYAPLISLQCDVKHNNTSRVQSALKFDNIMATFVADVESRVVVGLIGDELDSHSRALADHSLEWYLTTVTRVKEHNGASIQSAPQDQPARPELMDP